MAQMSFRVPAPVSHEAPCGDSVSLPGPSARQEAGAWLTCRRRCIPITFSSHGASVQAPDQAARPRSRSYHQSDPLPRVIQGPRVSPRLDATRSCALALGSNPLTLEEAAAKRGDLGRVLARLSMRMMASGNGGPVMVPVHATLSGSSVVR